MIVAVTDKARIGRHRGDGSGAREPEEFFEKASRGDEPEPPIGYPPRFHRSSLQTEAAARHRRLAQASPRAYELLHNRPQKHDAATRHFRRFRFTGPGSLAMIEAQNHPATNSKRRRRCRRQRDHGREWRCWPASWRSVRARRRKPHRHKPHRHRPRTRRRRPTTP